MSSIQPSLVAAAPNARAPQPFQSAVGRAGTSTISDRDAAAARIQRLARRFHRADLKVRRGRLWAMRATLVAPARAAREAVHAVRTYGRAAAEETGISPLRQGLWMWWLNLRYGYIGPEAYRFRLFTRDRVVPRPLFLQWEEAALLYRTVIPRTALAPARILADKRRFASWCAEQGLPTPPIFMEFEGGSVTRHGLGEGAEPDTDLFAKWGTQYGGDDTQRWRYDGTRWLDDDGEGWTFARVVETLRERSHEGVVLLQPRLVNHVALRPLSPNALSTIRVMTVRRPGDAPRFLAGVLRMGTGNSTADNFAQGGIASAIDAATGVIGEARRIDRQQRTYEYRAHPDTGAAIVGYRVPFWEESVRLALDAHTRLGPIACVGWDVAVLEDGPVLLEGNWNACTKLLQVATQTPLLATEFADTFAAWLDQPECVVDDGWLVEQERWTPV